MKVTESCLIDSSSTSNIHRLTAIGWFRSISISIDIDFDRYRFWSIHEFTFRIDPRSVPTNSTQTCLPLWSFLKWPLRKTVYFRRVWNAQIALTPIALSTWHIQNQIQDQLCSDYFADFCLLEMLANFPEKSGAYRQQRYTFFKSEYPPKTIKHTALQISQLTKADSWKREKVHVFMTYHNFSQRPQCNAFIQFCSAHIRKFVGTRRAEHDTVKVRREMLIL